MTSATCKGYAINAIIKNRAAKPTKTRRKMNSEKKAIIGSFAASLILAAIAIEFTASTSMGGRKADLEAAKELYDFICKNVELPDARPNPADGLVEFAKEYIEKLAKDKEKTL